MSLPLLSLQNVRAGDYLETVLEDVNWAVEPGQNWVVFGANGSGKTLLSRLLLGRVGVLSGVYEKGPGVVVQGFGFEEQQEIIARERYLDESEFRESEDPGTSVRRWVLENPAGTAPSFDLETGFDLQVWAERLQCVSILDRGLRYLSAGELRKASLLRILSIKARVLVLDEPYEGLDVASRQELRGILRDLAAEGRTLLIFCQRNSEVPECVTHGLVVDNRTLVYRGPLAGAQECFQKLTLMEKSLSYNADTLNQLFPVSLPQAEGPLIEMNNVTVRYGDFEVFHDLNWRVLPGENWLIGGPNGSGKSTLLNLIYGENNQVFTNDIRLWGSPRGSGESLWDIRQKIGFLSYAFHLQHQFLGGYTVREILISGYYDSIGLYRDAGYQEETKARAWLKLLGFSKPEEPFEHLSFGAQRLLLIARALVKGPQLVILDEPCQGMDQKQRGLILEFVDFFVQETNTQLLYVTHNPEETLGCLNRELILPWKPAT